jgi:hypothetical protein
LDQLQGARPGRGWVSESQKQCRAFRRKARGESEDAGSALSGDLFGYAEANRQKKPLVGIGVVAEELKLSIPTVTVALDHLTA